MSGFICINKCGQINHNCTYGDFFYEAVSNAVIAKKRNKLDVDIAELIHLFNKEEHLSWSIDNLLTFALSLGYNSSFVDSLEFDYNRSGSLGLAEVARSEVKQINAFESMTSAFQLHQSDQL